MRRFGSYMILCHPSPQLLVKVCAPTSSTPKKTGVNLDTQKQVGISTATIGEMLSCWIFRPINCFTAMAPIYLS